MKTEQTAEMRGYLHGFICSGAESEGCTWLDALEGALQAADCTPQRGALIKLYKKLSQDFAAEKLNFKQTIFKKKLPLNTRAYMLKKWCRGFLMGIQQSGLSAKQLSRIPMHYLEGLADLDAEEMDIGAADEAMFLQIMQLLEASTLQLYRILNQTKPKH